MRYALTLIATFSVAFAGLVIADSAISGPPAARALASASSVSLDDFMLVVHGPQGLRRQIQDAVAGSGPADDKAWKTLKARAVTIAYLTESVLVSAKPEKGDAASWKSKTSGYLGIVRALAKAADAKDSEGVKTELGKLGKTCEACHKAHQ